MSFAYDKRIINATEQIDADIEELLANAEKFAGCNPESSPQRDGIKRQITECLRAWVCQQIEIEDLKRRLADFAPGLHLRY